MSDSGRKQRHNRDAMGDNQTIFDFLKRKKQFSIEQSLNKSQSQHSNTKPKFDADCDDQFPQTRDLTKYRTYQSHRLAQTARQTITPKKIQFQETIKPGNKSVNKQSHQVVAGPSRRGKSFLDLISPVKNRSSSVLAEKNQGKQNEQQIKSAVKGGKSDHFTKGKVNKCINSIKETVNSLNDNIGRIKEKSHGLGVLFNPILNKFTDPSNPLSKQVGDLKNKLKAFEALINGVPIQDCDQLVENFHRNMEQHMQSELHYLRKDIQKEKSQQISHISEDKQAKIQKLQSDIRKLTKDNELLQRRLESVESSKGNLEEAVEQREKSRFEQMDRMKDNFEQTIEQLKNKNQDLEARLSGAQEQARGAQKNYKNERMVKQSLENRYRQEIHQISQVKDAYLLNQIMILKTEFNSDIARMNELHRIKEAELLNRINQKQEEVNKKMFEKGCDKQIQSKILQEANTLKQENLSIKNKSECLVTDMYRMNEELYQHWMALKDIKLLSTRLGSFPQYKKIYEDLIFNDHLFH